MSTVADECEFMDLDETLASFSDIWRKIELSPYQENGSYDSTHGEFSRRRIKLSISQDSNIASATCPMSYITDSFAATPWTLERDTTDYERMLFKSKPQSMSNMRSWSRPLVAVQCQTVDLLDSEGYGIHNHVRFGVELFHSPPWEVNSTYLGDLLKSIENDTHDRVSEPIFLNPHSETDAPISAAILMPSAYFDALQLENGDMDTQNFSPSHFASFKLARLRPRCGSMLISVVPPLSALTASVLSLTVTWAFQIRPR
ncbi:hypothetical protein B0J13DRAFT_528656 [Dactylonectria estremocensis]|uniref:Uncharacterized protein n=1 Tax=Dactylonectria estremocensis TaxID=1079267 RepID=A0A9P9IXU2_9HYPO|nr:hypothetical protein B0J13DRAFT_528656 [Dactylonectria estremocensis]